MTWTRDWNEWRVYLNRLMEIVFNSWGITAFFKRNIFHGINYLNPYKPNLNYYDTLLNQKPCTETYMPAGSGNTSSPRALKFYFKIISISINK
jgi:hypothetical protein